MLKISGFLALVLKIIKKKQPKQKSFLAPKALWRKRGAGTFPCVCPPTRCANFHTAAKEASLFLTLGTCAI